MKLFKMRCQVSLVVTLFGGLLGGCCAFCHRNDCNTASCCNLVVDGNLAYIAGPGSTLSQVHVEAHQDGQSLNGLRWNVHTSGVGANENSTPLISVFDNVYSNNTANGAAPNHLFPATPDGSPFVYIGYDDAHGNLPTSQPGYSGYPQCTLSQDIASPLEPGHNYKVSFLQTAFGDSLQQHGAVQGHVKVEVVPTGGGTAIYTGSFDVPQGVDLVASGHPWRQQTGVSFSVPTIELCTIKFTNDDSQRVAVVEDIALCSR